MIKIILLIGGAVLSFILYTLLNKFLGWVLHNAIAKKDANKHTGQPIQEELVRCAQCNTHIVKQKALQDKNNWFCCVQHKNMFHQP